MTTLLDPTPNARLGIIENLKQFSILVIINALVGSMVGLERSILPSIAEQDFGIRVHSATLGFIAVFGVCKAITNYFAGRWSDRYGRLPVLRWGWLIATPIPFILMWADTWSQILFANVLLGISQGLTWSTTVIMKIDLAGPKRRGLALGINECAGYLSVGLTALLTSYIAADYGLRPHPFYLGVVIVILGVGLSFLSAKETAQHVSLESTQALSPSVPQDLTPNEIAIKTSLTDRELSSACQAGLVNNLNDGMAWGLFPLLFLKSGFTVSDMGTLTAIYPAVWGLGQLFMGALSDQVGRKGLIIWGMWLQSLAIILISLSRTFTLSFLGMALLGLGTAMVYPTLLAVIGDVAHPQWRASAVGIYRLWRDMGYAVGALLAGVIAYQFGLSEAAFTVGLLTALSGLVVAFRMRETLKK